MVDIEAIMKQRRIELHSLLRKYSPRYRTFGFKVRYCSALNHLVLCTPNKEANWLSFDIIECLQMFCRMYSLLWLVEVDDKTGALRAIITTDFNLANEI